ncbi:Cobalt-zinc-cadmium resistance protein CzcA [Novipirellula artificiosorum]|uniref:Cobalt-zinc-cadmium resistance protein CzcA n=2 Tax=Novipirellula artificiosorum TaxID=2528016 RepID=A0A5C6DSL9_9BACT|nr:Cobalt-zinc-cadmium resistance protein CzcA [Novipirellula artificiosorum]
MLRSAYQNPRLVILAVALIIVSGVAGFYTRVAREDPKSQVRWGYVTTQLPGAEPLEIESLISEPIERMLREAGTVRSIESSSLRGVSLVFIRLTDEVTDVTQSWSKIQDKLSEVAGQLPARATVPVLVDERRWGSHTRVVALYEKENTAVPAGLLARWAKELDNRLSFVLGTRFTETFGIPSEEIAVEIDEQTIAAMGITIQEIASRIRARDSEGLDALSQSSGHTMPVSLAGDVDSLDHLRSLVLRGDPSDRRLLLGDVATISRSERQPRDQTAIVQGRRAAVVATRMDDSYGIDAWTDRQQQVLDDFQSSIPEGLEIAILFDQKRYTDERAGNLYQSLGMGMALVIVVVCMMMGWRAAIPICTALPLTLCMVFFLMIPFGISLHQMSIAGLILALGMLIDNPIIVVDEIQRRLDAGDEAFEALRHSIRRLTKPLLGANVTTILGFCPILLIGGPTGEFMEQLGWAVIACLIGSLVLSLTLIPVLAAWCLRPSSTAAELDVPYFDIHRSKPNLLARAYAKFLQIILRFPLLAIGLTLIVPACGFHVARTLPEQFFPVAERDHFHFSVRLPTDASISETEQAAMLARRVVIRHPEVEDVAMFVGKSAPKLHYSMVALEDNRPNFAQGLVQLSTPTAAVDLIRQIQTELDNQLPQAQCIVTLIEQGPPAPAPIEFRLYGPSLEKLAELGDQTQALLMQVPGVIHTRTSLDPGGPVFDLDIEQSEAERSGLMDEFISRQLRDRLDGVIAAKMSEEIEEIPIRVRLKNSQATNPARVLSMPLVTPGNLPQVVPLSSLAHWRVKPQIFSIFRRNSSRCNIVSAYVEAGRLPIAIEQDFKAQIQAKGFALPRGYRYDFGGISSERDSAVGNLAAFSAVVAVLAVAVLVLTFGSFRLALIIMGVTVLAVGLGLGSLWLFGYPIGIISLIGMAGMVGLAVNDSIVVLSECQIGEQQSQPIERSVYASTRHVFTTSVTTVAGVLPLILRGGVFWPPMMIVIAGGVVGATAIALCFTPACFELIKPRNRPVTG